MNLPEQNRDKTQPLDDTARTQTNRQTVAGNRDIPQLFQIERLSPTAWAYIGDAVYELFIRIKFSIPPKRMADYHSQVVARVRAESQANYLIFLEPHLTDFEKDILRRGRNACVNKPKRLDPHIYQQATSLEALIGYLHLTDPQRLDELFAILELKII